MGVHPQILQIQSDENGDIFFIVDTIIVFFFTVDYFGRLLTCPSKRAFFRSFLNFIDVISIIPYYVQISVLALCMPAWLHKPRRIIVIAGKFANSQLSSINT
jgi:hypothetical protein